MSDHDQDLGDYVLVHKSKAKISRARKAVIGLMAIGAVAAIAGGGTFASFSASTSNDASFKTGRLDLSNKVDTAQACFASATNADRTNDDSDANTDDNDTVCDALFDNNLRPGTAATAEITLTNVSTSDYTGRLTVFADTTTFGGCVSELNETGEIGGSANLCNGVEMMIQEAADNTFTGLTCVWPAGDCDLDDDTGTISDFITAHDDFATERLELEASLPTTESRYFVISMKLGSAGGFSSTGIGLDNIYMNKKANLGLRFHLADVA